MPASSLVDSSLDGDAALLKRAVREAGMLARSMLDGNIASWNKAEDGTPVTGADLAVDHLLKERLDVARPGYGWLSEETADDGVRLARARVWIVDPIDGTRAFIAGTAQWTISVALAEHGRPVLAAIFNPVTDEFFFAREGAGAKLNGAPVAIADRGMIEGCRMLANGRAFSPKRWKDPWPEMEIGYRNSVAYRLCLVANGHYDAAFAISAKSDWDLAAADLMVHEAGGQLSDYRGRRFVYNRRQVRHLTFLAAGPRLHTALLRRTRELKTT